MKEEQNESQNSAVAVIETPEEQELDELVKLEDRIRTGVRHCFETGMLLERIRKEKLYLLRGYKSFQCYCEEMFHIDRSYGYRLITCYRVRSLLPEDSRTLIPERLIRPLASLPPEVVVKIWQLEKQVDEYRKRILDDELTEKFGPCDEESFFSYVLKRKLDTRTTVSELIESTKSRQALITAVKELKPLGIAFSPEEEGATENRNSPPPGTGIGKTLVKTSPTGDTFPQRNNKPSTGHEPVEGVLILFMGEFI